MNQLIERYVYEVIKRLPEKERHDVKEELEANIRDMLSYTPTEEEIKKVLNQLGDPALLSRKYRQNPRYLISPDTFEFYLSALKIVLPIIGSVFFFIGMIVYVMDSLMGSKEVTQQLIRSIIAVIAAGFAGAIDGVFQGLVITTIVFVILDYTGKKVYEKTKVWTVENLPKEKVPKEVTEGKGAIPLSKGIGELAAAVCFTCLLVFFCLGWIPGVISFQNDTMHVLSVQDIFEPSFLRLSILVFLFLGLCKGIESVIKMIYRKWCIPVCIAVLCSNLLGMGAILFLLTRSVMFVPNLRDLLAQHTWGKFDFMQFAAAGNTNPILLLIGGAVVIGNTISCIEAIVKTVKNCKGEISLNKFV